MTTTSVARIVPLARQELAAVAPNWSAMRTAIMECERIDEVRGLADKAVALRAYYAQSQDVDNEVAAMRVRIRAERRMGELIQQEQAAGRIATRSDGPAIRDHVVGDDKVQTLSDLGIPRDRSARAQKLAEVPEHEFEAALQAPKPSLRSITALAPQREVAPKPKPIDVEQVLKTWGTLRDFVASIKDGSLLDPTCWRDHPGLQPFQRAEINDAIPIIVGYLKTMEQHVEH